MISLDITRKLIYLIAVFVRSASQCRALETSEVTKNRSTYPLNINMILIITRLK